MMRRVLIVYKVQDADVKPTELSQIAGGGMANKSLDRECRYLADPFCSHFLFSPRLSLPKSVELVLETCPVPRQ